MEFFTNIFKTVGQCGADSRDEGIAEGAALVARAIAGKLLKAGMTEYEIAEIMFKANSAVPTTNIVDAKIVADALVKVGIETAGRADAIDSSAETVAQSDTP